MTAWTLIDQEFDDGSDPSALLRQAADWLDAHPPHPLGGLSYNVVGINWSQQEWVGSGGSDDVLTLFVHIAPEEEQ